MFIYIFGNNAEGYYKIGISENPNKRLGGVQVGCPFPLEIIKTFETNQAKELESKVHKRLKEFNSSGEWFKLPKLELIKIIIYISDCLGLKCSFKGQEHLFTEAALAIKKQRDIFERFAKEREEDSKRRKEEYIARGKRQIWELEKGDLLYDNYN